MEHVSVTVSHTGHVVQSQGLFAPTGAKKSDKDQRFPIGNGHQPHRK
jgi:hypothetical protein